jgi:hypothetical protein
LNPATVRTHQHVAVQEIAVYEVAALGAGPDQCLHPVADRCGQGREFRVGVQGGAPSVHPVPRIVHQPGEDKFPPAADRRACRVPHHRGSWGGGYPVERDEQAGEGVGDVIGALDWCVLQEPPVMTYRDGVGPSGRCATHLPYLRYRQIRPIEGHSHPVGFVPGTLTTEADHQLLPAHAVGPCRGPRPAGEGFQVAGSAAGVLGEECGDVFVRGPSHPASIASGRRRAPHAARSGKVDADPGC